MVLTGDLGAPGGQVLDRVVGAVVAEGQLVGLQPDGAAQQLVAEADPVHRQLADELAHRVRRCSPARPGRRGRWRGRSRRGRWRAAAPALAVHGCSSTVAPRSRRLRTIDSLTPVSIMAIRGPPLALDPDDHARSGVTSRARSRPLMAGSAAISSRASSAPTRAGKHPAAHRAGVADVAHERARVEVGDGRDACVASASPATPLGPGGVLAVGRGAHDRGAGVHAV